MADNNVFILFEEIKTALKGINGKLEELPRLITRQPQTGNDKPDLSPIKDAVAETVKAQFEEIKGLLARQWKAYSQLSPPDPAQTQYNQDAGRARGTTRVATAGTYPQAQFRHQVKQGLFFCRGAWCGMRLIPVGQHRAMAVQTPIRRRCVEVPCHPLMGRMRC